jgi:putative glycerol-1-phosphate prenyltransferase
MHNTIYQHICRLAQSNRKQLALLIDPDKYSDAQLSHVMDIANKSHVDYIFVGGSLLVDNRVGECIHIIKDCSEIPVVLFPGSPSQVHPDADAILFLSLISGRNADLLIGRHVEAAPILKKTGLEVMPTGYMLIDSGLSTTASYISNTLPIPAHKPDIAACTAMAGEMLGLKLIYMDGGSGAAAPVPAKMIETVKKHVDLPIIVGGGIRSKEELAQTFAAGADVAVVGNAVESNPELLRYFSAAINAPA